MNERNLVIFHIYKGILRTKVQVRIKIAQSCKLYQSIPCVLENKKNFCALDFRLFEKPSISRRFAIFNLKLLIPRAKIKCDLNVTLPAQNMYLRKVFRLFAKYRRCEGQLQNVCKIDVVNVIFIHFADDLDEVKIYQMTFVRSIQKLHSTFSRRKQIDKKFAQNLHEICICNFDDLVKVICKKFAFSY